MPKSKITTLLVILILLAGAFYFLFLGGNKADDPMVHMSFDEYKVYLIDALVREVYGDTIMGYTPSMLIETFSGLTNNDFDNVPTDYGMYSVVDGGIVFRPDEPGVNDSKFVISPEGTRIFLNNVANRLGDTIDTREQFEGLLMKIK